MKKFRCFFAVFGVLLLLNGCSGEPADETTSPETLRREASVMRLYRLKKTVANYDEAIAKKSALLKSDEEKLAAIPLEQQFSEEAKSLREAIDRNQVSLLRLRLNRQSCVEVLETRQK